MWDDPNKIDRWILVFKRKKRFGLIPFKDGMILTPECICLGGYQGRA